MFSRFAQAVSRWTGSPVALLVVAAFTAAWFVFGDHFGFNEIATIAPAWLLVLDKADFNRVGDASQAKLDTLILAIPDACNDAIGLDKRDAAEIEAMRP